MEIKRLSSFINEVAAAGDWCVYDTKTGKVHSTYSSHKKALNAMKKLNDTHDGYETPGNLIQDKFGAKVVKESLDEGKVEQGHTFQVGDVVEIVWKDISGETKHGTANIDSATSAYATATHPSIKDLKIKVHQGINGKGGNQTGTNPGTRAGGYKFVKKTSTNESGVMDNDEIRALEKRPIEYTKHANRKSSNAKDLSANADFLGSDKYKNSDNIKTKLSQARKLAANAHTDAAKAHKEAIAKYKSIAATDPDDSEAGITLHTKLAKDHESSAKKYSTKHVNESFIFEGENLSKLVNYAKANPEIGDAVGLVVKKYISKMNPNVASIITSTVKETGVPKQKLLDALTELGFTELTGAA